MSDDLIKRSDAIRAIDELPNAYNGWSDAYDKAYIIGTLEEVPSADRPQGEWICHEGGWKNFDYYPTKYECDQCHHYVDVASDKNFCPNCGARMKGADDGNK